MRNGQCGRGARKARSDASMLQLVTMAAARTRRRFARGGVGAVIRTAPQSIYLTRDMYVCPAVSSSGLNDLPPLAAAFDEHLP